MVDFHFLFCFKWNRYHLRDPTGKLLEEQKGVVRTNCIDCLDRTNVTQVSPCSPACLTLYAVLSSNSSDGNSEYLLAISLIHKHMLINPEIVQCAEFAWTQGSRGSIATNWSF